MVGPRAPDRPVPLVDDEVPIGLHRQEGPGVLGRVGRPQRVPLPGEDEVPVTLHRQPVVAVRRLQPRPTLELGANHELCPVPVPRSGRGGDLVRDGSRIARRRACKHGQSKRSDGQRSVPRPSSSIVWST